MAGRLNRFPVVWLYSSCSSDAVACIIGDPPTCFAILTEPKNAIREIGPEQCGRNNTDVIITEQITKTE
jgi:hypothetical protein